jgi:hypothetical protein
MLHYYVNNFFRFMTHGRAMVDRLVVQALLRSIGWSLNADDSVMGTAVSALGFEFDIVNATISVMEGKRLALRTEILDALSSGSNPTERAGKPEREISTHVSDNTARYDLCLMPVEAA